MANFNSFVNQKRFVSIFFVFIFSYFTYDYKKNNQSLKYKNVERKLG